MPTASEQEAETPTAAVKTAAAEARAAAQQLLTDVEAFRDGRAYSYRSIFSETIGGPQRTSAARPQPPPQAPPPEASPPQAPEPEASGIDEVAKWLEEDIGLEAVDAMTCANILFDEGCRSKEDVNLLAECDELPKDIPKVMRMKLMTKSELKI